MTGTRRVVYLMCIGVMCLSTLFILWVSSWPDESSSSEPPPQPDPAWILRSNWRDLAQAFAALAQTADPDDLIVEVNISSDTGIRIEYTASGRAPLKSLTWNLATHRFRADAPTRTTYRNYGFRLSRLDLGRLRAAARTLERQDGVLPEVEILGDGPPDVRLTTGSMPMRRLYELRRGRPVFLREIQ